MHSSYLLAVASLSIGVLWVFYARFFLKLRVPFRYSGLFTGIWFLPSLIAASVLLRESAPYMPSSLGIVFGAEVLAAFISGALGPLSWISFHFGLAQGFAAELAFQVTHHYFGVAAALLTADIILLKFHPRLKDLSAQSAKNWLWHILGGAVSTAVVAILVHLFFGMPTAIASESPERILHVVTDLDSTMADTDQFLVDFVIPPVAESLLPNASPQTQKEIRRFLKALNINGKLYFPRTYSEAAWRMQEKWKFPESLDVSKFWALMSEQFKKITRSGTAPIVVFHHFKNFYKNLNWRFGGNVQWTVLTARTEDLVKNLDFSSELAMRTSKYPLTILSREKKRGASSEENAQFKVAELAKLGPIDIFIDNDPIILKHVQLAFPNVVLVHAKAATKKRPARLKLFKPASGCIEALHLALKVRSH